MIEYLIITMIILAVVGSVISIEPSDKWDNNYHGQCNNLKEKEGSNELD